MYLWVVVDFKQNNKAKLLQMTRFMYNNIMNASTKYTFFELKYSYYLYILYKKDVNSCSKSKSVNELLAKVQKLIIIC